MPIQNMTIQYAYYAITDPGYPEGYSREYVTGLDEEIDPNDVAEMVQHFKGESYTYDYILVEKQLHPE